jgi:hypothetical protein
VNEDEDEWNDNINSNFIMAKTLNDTRVINLTIMRMKLVWARK